MEDDTAASLSSLLAPHFEDYQQTEAKSELDLQRRVKAIQKEIEKYNNSAHQGEKPVSKESKQKGKKKSSAAASGTNENASLALLHFFECVISAPLLSENKVGADNVLELTAEVAVASGNDITELVLQRAMEFTNVLLERARCVACRFIGFLVKALMNKEVPKDDLLDKASQVLLPRFTDKSQAVRQAAVEAGQYFFKGSSTDPDIMQATLFIVQHDPSVANRIAALESLPVNLETLDALLSRVRDVKSKVRSSALEVLLENNSQIWDAVLHSEHFATLVESGCTDRCETTNETMRKLVCYGWMKAAAFDPIKLLEKMEPVLYDEQCEKAMKIIMEASDDFLAEGLDDSEISLFRQGIQKASISITTDLEDSVESIFFSRVACEHATKSSVMASSMRETLLLKVIPEIPQLCRVLEQFALKLMESINEGNDEEQEKYAFICQQLARMTTLTDLEAGSRRHLTTVMQRMLQSVLLPEDLVQVCVDVLSSVGESESELLGCAIEITDNVASLYKESEELQELEANCLVRVLSILTAVMDKIPPTPGLGSYHSNFSNHIMEYIAHSDVTVREAAVSSLGKLGLFSEPQTVLSEFKPLLMKIASNEKEQVEIRGQALLALSDWSVLIHGVLDPLEVDETSISFGDIVFDTLKQMRDPSIVCIASEIASKLLFSGKVRESEWLAQLVMIYFDPMLNDLAQEEEAEEVDAKDVCSPVRAQQLLSIFFPALCLREFGRELIVQSIGPLLYLVHEKQSQKKVKALPVAKMIEYIREVLMTELSEGETSSVSDETDPTGSPTVEPEKDTSIASVDLMTATQIASFLAAKGSDMGKTFVRTVCKLLASCSVDPDAEPYKEVCRLKQEMEEASMAVSDDTALGYLSALFDVLADVEILSDNESGDEDDNEDEEEEVGEEDEEVEARSPVLDKENDGARDERRASLDASSPPARRPRKGRSSLGDIGVADVREENVEKSDEAGPGKSRTRSRQSVESIVSTASTVL